MYVNNLRKFVTWQRHSQESNTRPFQLQVCHLGCNTARPCLFRLAVFT